jgi:hypothetical protein
MLKRWRLVVKKAVNIIKRIYPDSEIYLAGGAAENRLTVLSDIDILVVFNERKSEKREILANIWKEMESEIPVYYPIEIHILDKDELSMIKGKKIRL